MKVGVVSNITFNKQDNKTNFQGKRIRNFVDTLVYAEKIEKGKIRAPKIVRELIRGLLGLIDNPYYRMVKNFEVANKKAIAETARVLKSPTATPKEKKKALNRILKKAKENKDANELYYHVLRRFTPHIVRSKDEKMAKYILRLTRTPITELDTLGRFKFFCTRMRLISELGSKRNIKDIEKEVQRLEFITDNEKRRATEAIKKLSTNPNF